MKYIPILLILFIAGCATTQSPPVQEQKSPGCRLSDLSINANLPEGYTRIPTECPKVAYNRNLSPSHALGFFITETPTTYHSSDKKSPAETVDDYVLIVQVQYDKAYEGQSYNTLRIDNNADFPPSLVDHGGTCAGLVARTPIPLVAKTPPFDFMYGGVQWQRGIMCLVELPPEGSEKWAMIQAFFYDMNIESADYKPAADFDQLARELFRSIRIRNEE
jgi:hypothetical protein